MLIPSKAPALAGKEDGHTKWNEKRSTRFVTGEFFLRPPVTPPPPFRYCHDAGCVYSTVLRPPPRADNTVNQVVPDELVVASQHVRELHQHRKRLTCG